MSLADLSDEQKSLRASDVRELNLVKRVEVALVSEARRDAPLNDTGTQLLLPLVDPAYHKLGLTLAEISQLLNQGVLLVDERRNLELLITISVCRCQLVLKQLAFLVKLCHLLAILLRLVVLINDELLELNLLILEERDLGLLVSDLLCEFLDVIVHVFVEFLLNGHVLLQVLDLRL